MSAEVSANAWNVRELVWVVAMWKAIHGGDPGPENAVEVHLDERTVELGTAFIESLAQANQVDDMTSADLTAALGRIGITPQPRQDSCPGLTVTVTGSGLIKAWLDNGAVEMSDKYVDGQEVATFCVDRIYYQPTPGGPGAPYVGSHGRLPGGGHITAG